MAAEEFKRRLTAILSADVEGYSRLMREDEEATVRTLTTYRTAIVHLIEQYRGRVVDSPGDNILAEFTSVVDAVNCGVEIQRELAERNAELPENRRMQFRIGINLGDVLEEGDRIYGDGVNIAARMESLAVAGEICISGTVYDAIENKIGLEYEYLGEHEVKNIDKPIRTYRVLSYPGAAAHRVVKAKKAVGKTWRNAIIAIVTVLFVGAAVAVWHFYFRPPPIEPASLEKMAYPLPEKPSIAVLPFSNLSDDSDQEYFSDGITEEIITALSKTPKLFVIASNSVFTYKVKPVKVQQVAEELGVRYVLEGSVRKAGERVRVTAQLIDAITGHHLWSERYDRKIEDSFVIQDEIALKIISALQVELTEGEHAYMLVKGTNNLEAYLKALKAVHHFRRFSADDNARCRQLAQEIVALDPKYPTGWVMLAWADLQAVQFGWSKSPKKSMEQAVESTRKVQTLGEHQGAHYLFGYICLLSKQHEKAINELQTALDFVGSNSADINAVLGYTLNVSGRPEEGIEYLKKGMRLNPIYPSWYLLELGNGYRLSGKYQEAIRAYESRLRRKDARPLSAHVDLAMTYVLLGKNEEAQAHVNEILKLDPKYCLESYAKRRLYKDKALLERDLDALRKAGLSEHPSLPLPDKPSIAVLPFTNMSGNPEQEYFSDGITEEIITALSKIPKLFVIARNSTFTYKGKPVKVQQVGHELGVKYVLEGSVRKAEDRVRVTAQLIDAQSGNHMWAERYDRDLKDIFAIQDEVTLKVITALQVKLSEGEEIRIYAKGTQSLEAYLRFLEGRRYLNQVTREGNAHARQFLREAITLDSEYAAAYAFLAMTHLRDIVMMATKSPEESLAKAIELAKKAIELDESLADAHALLGYLFTMRRQHDKGVAQAEQAIALNPNSASAYHWYGLTLNYAGRHEEAIKAYRKGIRLNPFPPTRFYFCLAIAYRDAKRYEEAIAASKKALEQAPDCLFAHTCLASCYALMGRREDAHAEMEEALRINPKLSLAGTAKMIMYKYEADREFLIESFRKAGLKY